jgi:HEAT repeat protein
MNAAEALGRLGDPKAVEALLSLLKDEMPEVRESAVFALGELGDERILAPLTWIRESDTDYTMDNTWIRDAAVRAMARIQERLYKRKEA